MKTCKKYRPSPGITNNIHPFPPVVSSVLSASKVHYLRLVTECVFAVFVRYAKWPPPPYAALTVWVFVTKTQRIYQHFGYFRKPKTRRSCCIWTKHTQQTPKWEVISIRALASGPGLRNGFRLNLVLGLIQKNFGTYWSTVASMSHVALT